MVFWSFMLINLMFIALFFNVAQAEQNIGSEKIKWMLGIVLALKNLDWNNIKEF